MSDIVYLPNASAPMHPESRRSCALAHTLNRGQRWPNRADKEYCPGFRHGCYEVVVQQGKQGEETGHCAEGELHIKESKIFSEVRLTVEELQGEEQEGRPCYSIWHSYAAAAEGIQVRTEYEKYVMYVKVCMAENFRGIQVLQILRLDCNLQKYSPWTFCISQATQCVVNRSNTVHHCSLPMKQWRRLSTMIRGSVGRTACTS